jgi:hypothetical protein
MFRIFKFRSSLSGSGVGTSEIFFGSDRLAQNKFGSDRSAQKKFGSDRDRIGYHEKSISVHFQPQKTVFLCF